MTGTLHPEGPHRALCTQQSVLPGFWSQSLQARQHVQHVHLFLHGVHLVEGGSLQACDWIESPVAAPCGSYAYLCGGLQSLDSPRGPGDAPLAEEEADVGWWVSALPWVPQTAALMSK